MINIEKYYKWMNIILFPLAILMLVCAWHGGISYWWPIVTAISPTIMLMVVVAGALLWSMYLTRKK